MHLTWDEVVFICDFAARVREQANYVSETMRQELATDACKVLTILGDEKSVEACRAKFDNVTQFRGFPTVPDLPPADRERRKRE